jgi:hypothetical protein
MHARKRRGIGEEELEDDDDPGSSGSWLFSVEDVGDKAVPFPHLVRLEEDSIAGRDIIHGGGHRFFISQFTRGKGRV